MVVHEPFEAPGRRLRAGPDRHFVDQEARLAQRSRRQWLAAYTDMEGTRGSIKLRSPSRMQSLETAVRFLRAL